MPIARLTVRIESGSMLEKVEQIQEKASELDKLVRELQSMSGDYKTYEQSGLPEVEESADK